MTAGDWTVAVIAFVLGFAFAVTVVAISHWGRRPK